MGRGSTETDLAHELVLLPARPRLEPALNTRIERLKSKILAGTTTPNPVRVDPAYATPGRFALASATEGPLLFRLQLVDEAVDALRLGAELVREPFGFVGLFDLEALDYLKPLTTFCELHTSAEKRARVPVASTLYKRAENALQLCALPSTVKISGMWEAEARQFLVLHELPRAHTPSGQALPRRVVADFFRDPGQAERLALRMHKEAEVLMGIFDLAEGDGSDTLSVFIDLEAEIDGVKTIGHAFA